LEVNNALASRDKTDLFENFFCIGSGFLKKVKETKSDIHFFVKSDIL